MLYSKVPSSFIYFTGMKYRSYGTRSQESQHSRFLCFRTTLHSEGYYFNILYWPDTSPLCSIETRALRLGSTSPHHPIYFETRAHRLGSTCLLRPIHSSPYHVCLSINMNALFSAIDAN